MKLYSRGMLPKGQALQPLRAISLFLAFSQLSSFSHLLHSLESKAQCGLETVCLVRGTMRNFPRPFEVRTYFDCSFFSRRFVCRRVSPVVSAVFGARGSGQANDGTAGDGHGSDLTMISYSSCLCRREDDNV